MEQMETQKNGKKKKSRKPKKPVTISEEPNTRTLRNGRVLSTQAPLDKTLLHGNIHRKIQSTRDRPHLLGIQYLQKNYLEAYAKALEKRITSPQERRIYNVRHQVFMTLIRMFIKRAGQYLQGKEKLQAEKTATKTAQTYFQRYQEDPLIGAINPKQLSKHQLAFQDFIASFPTRVSVLNATAKFVQEEFNDKFGCTVSLQQDFREQTYNIWFENFKGTKRQKKAEQEIWNKFYLFQLYRNHHSQEKRQTFYSNQRHYFAFHGKKIAQIRYLGGELQKKQQQRLKYVLTVAPIIKSNDQLFFGKKNPPPKALQWSFKESRAPKNELKVKQFIFPDQTPRKLSKSRFGDQFSQKKHVQHVSVAQPPKKPLPFTQTKPLPPLEQRLQKAKVSGQLTFTWQEMMDQYE